MNYIFAQQRLLRAIIYGSGTAPLAHVHFNFLEWLVVKKVGNRLKRWKYLVFWKNTLVSLKQPKL